MSLQREVTVAAVRVPRAVAVWLVVSGLTAGAGALALPGASATVRVVAGGSEWQRVDSAIADLCSLALAAATAWGWAVTTATIAGLLRGRATTDGGLTRQMVLLACGAALAVATGPAAVATDGTSSGLHGLPYPDRPVSAGTSTVPAPPPPARPSGRAVTPAEVRTVVVEPGDSLWAIAARTALPGEPVAEHWRAIISANPGLVDPDLVLPGQHIVVPHPAGAR